MAGTIRKRTWITGKGEAKTAWVADYFDQHRKRHKKQFPTRRGADQWLLRARGEVRDGVHTPDNVSITVGEAADLWLQRAAANGLDRGSQRTYQQMARLAIVPLLGEVRLSRLTRAMVETFRDELLDKFAYARARQALAALRSVVDHAQGRGLVAQNVARGVRIQPRARLQEQLIVGRTIPAPNEVRQLLAAADGWLRVMITTAAFTGMRAGELRGLWWEDVDLTAGAERVVVRQCADQWGELGRPKSKAGQRTIALASSLATELRPWRFLCGHPVNVFPGQAGQVISQSAVTRAFAQLQIETGLTVAGKPKYTFHALRHFFASVMIGLGYTSKWLQVTMGHENIVLTLGTYGHLFPDSDGERTRMAAFEAVVLG
ncbi:MAG TPA: site-specific integrase [Stellaceae bacterium]|nr:site-specific integrase [Stellaceae bacterium]